MTAVPSFNLVAGLSGTSTLSVGAAGAAAHWLDGHGARLRRGQRAAVRPQPLFA